MTNDEIIKAVRLWQAHRYHAPMTCQVDHAHGNLAPIEQDGIVVLACPVCNYQERIVPSAVLKASRNGDGSTD